MSGLTYLRPILLLKNSIEEGRYENRVFARRGEGYLVLIQGLLAVKKARQLIKLLYLTHVIVHRVDPKDYYYLYTVAEAVRYLPPPLMKCLSMRPSS